jgi:hypothetical protein
MFIFTAKHILLTCLQLNCNTSTKFKSFKFLLDFKLSPCLKCRVFSFGLFPGVCSLTLSNPIFLPPAYSQALIYFGQKRGWWVTCNYPTVLKEVNRNRKSTTCAICWLKSVLHEEKRPDKKIIMSDDAFPHVVLTLANR